MKRATLLGVLLVAVGCGDASGVDELESDGVGESVAALAQSSLSDNPWSEADRVFCSEAYSYAEREGTDTERRVSGEFEEIPGAQGDVFVVRTCNDTLRFNGSRVDGSGTTPDGCRSRLRALKSDEDPSVRIDCYQQIYLHSEREIETYDATFYVRYIGNLRDFGLQR